MKMLRNTLLFSVTTSDAVNLLSKKTSLSKDLHEKVTADSSKARDDSYEHQSPVAKIGPLEVEIEKGVADAQNTSTVIEGSRTRGLHSGDGVESNRRSSEE